MFTKKLYFGTDTIMRSNMGLRSYAAFSCDNGRRPFFDYVVTIFNGLELTHSINFFADKLLVGKASFFSRSFFHSDSLPTIKKSVRERWA